MHDETVGDLAGHVHHPRPEAPDEHRRWTERVRSRIEGRRHEGVAVELAAEVQGAAGVPGGPDGFDGEHDLADAAGRMRPGLAEPLLDVGPDLRAEAEHEPALGHSWRSWPMLARTMGLRAKPMATAVPRRIVLVVVAAAASGRNGS